MTKPEGWYDDPSLEGRNRYWDGEGWTSHVATPGGETYAEPYLGESGTRWQYGVVNIGAFKALGRMGEVLGHLGSEGWELITVYDKSSNWISNMEKGFMMFKRPVAPGVRLPDDHWCITLTMTS